MKPTPSKKNIEPHELAGRMTADQLDQFVDRLFALIDAKEAAKAGGATPPTDSAPAPKAPVAQTSTIVDGGLKSDLQKLVEGAQKYVQPPGAYSAEDAKHYAALREYETWRESVMAGYSDDDQEAAKDPGPAKQPANNKKKAVTPARKARQPRNP